MKPRFLNYWRLALALFVGLLTNLISLPSDSPAHAHGGGTPRLTAEPIGPYRLYAWSEPEPWRVGQVHLSLAVTMPNPDTTSNQVEMPVTDVDITVTYTAIQDNQVDTAVEPIVVTAVRQEFLNDFYYEADPVLTREGEWQITVDVDGPEGSGSTQFTMQTFPERSLNWALIGGAGVLLVVILALIAIWSRSQQPAKPAQRPHRGVRRVQRRSGKAVIRKEA
jgi:hypothetical protein